MANRKSPGSIYFLVLAICLLVSLMGLGAVLAARAQNRATGQTTDFDQARLYARSAVELGAFLANQDGFRNAYTNGTWIAAQKLGGGSFSLSGNNVDPSLPLNNSDSDPVLLTAIGYQGIAVHKTQVQLVARPVPFNCLQTCADFGGNVTLGSATSQVTLTCNQPFSTNSNLTAILANLNGPLESAGVITVAVGCTGNFTSSPISPRQLPDPMHVFDYYKSHATVIPPSTIYSSTMGACVIQKCLLSPGSNPFGATNPQGIYLVDLGSLGGTLIVQNCRIVGTLVILNANTGSSVSGSVNWAPAVSNFPCLLVQTGSGSSFALQYTNTVLSERTIGANLNPPSTPYQGSSNGNQRDTYPSVINGLIYCSGSMTVSNSVTLKGVLLANGGLTWTGGAMSLSYDNTYFQSPPPGFYPTPVPMVASPATFGQLAN